MLDCRIVTVAALLMVAVPGISPAAEISYRGDWRCEALPSANLSAVRADAMALRNGPRLTVWRPVRTPDGSRELGRETGTTTIRDGRFTLETSVTLPRTVINGTFVGSATDTEIAFSGVQKVQLDAGGFGERRCRVTLTRQ
ncbi:hypothetical protein [Elioraea tepidiphila]|jgi:hypothetical protein|uniref:hypothetical protein n=1 Tax=Elioraea tepidiphila TaxID=457934 RepID=UPI002FD90E59